MITGDDGHSNADGRTVIAGQRTCKALRVKVTMTPKTRAHGTPGDDAGFTVSVEFDHLVSDLPAWSKRTEP